MDERGSDTEPLVETRGSRPNLVLIAVLALALILIPLSIATLVFVLKTHEEVGPGPYTTTTPAPAVCRTAGCQDAGAVLKSNVNLTVDPCDDFYEFACGNWMKTHDIPKGKEIIGSFEIRGAAEVNVTAELLQQQDQSAPRSVQMSRSFYNVCMHSNQEHQYAVNVNKTLTLLNNYGVWPVLDRSWNDSNFDLGLMVGRLSGEQGIPSVITTGFDVDWRQVSRYTIYLDQATLGLPDPYYTDAQFADALADYKKSIVDAATKLANVSHANVTAAEIAADAERIIAIETALSKFNVPATQRRNYSAMYFPVAIGDLGNLPEYSFIDWTAFFKVLVPPDVYSVVVRPDYMLVVSSPSYFKQLKSQFESFSNRDWQVYLLWRLVNSQISLLGLPSVDATGTLKRPGPIRYVVSDASADVENCVSQTINLFPWPVGRIFAVKTFPVEYQPDVKLFISSLIDSVASLFIGLPWMDTKSKLNAERKQAGYVKNAVFPPWIMNDTLLDNYYAGLELSASYDFFDLNQVLATWTAQKLARKLLAKSVDRTDFQSSPAVLNAWYNPMYNSITIPAAILQTPFYRYDYPKAYNYGGIGAVIGHEISHGFDDEGVQFYDDGTLNTWMDSSSFGGFQKMAQCVVDEYSGFCYPELQLCVNGINTQGENLADNAGIKAAWLSYQLYLFSHGSEGRLPGMEQFTDEQIFFLSYANTWCENRTKKSLVQQLELNAHSPGKWRVNGVLQNFDRFAHAFSCKAGSRMSPSTACNVW